MEDLLQEEIVKLEGELTKLKSAVEYIETAKISIEAASKIINTIIKLKEEFDRLSEKAYALIRKMDEIDFPSRLDKIDSKIDSKIASLSSDIQNLQMRIEAGNKSIITEMKVFSKNISSDLGDSKIKIISRLETQSKAIRLILYSIIGVFVLIMTMGALFY
ncbi:MAG: hypothetical protein WBN42_08805, partial [Ignavibacteriaceae bacterium]